MSAETALASLQERAARVLMNTYRRLPVTFVRGQGCWLVDDGGRQYLDLVGGIAVNVLGHSAPAVRAALEQQSAQLVHVSNLYYSEPQVELAERLVRSAFPARVFFCNSGAEANEAAIKIARKWGQRHRGGAYRIVCAVGAFHGRTLATLAATGRYLDTFAPAVDGFAHVPFDDADAVAAAIDDSVVAVMLEPALGEGGIVPMGDDTLRRIRALCDQRDVLLVLDEVQSGMGRTGRWWAHQHAGVTPDVMTVAKGLGGGIPIGAALAAPRADVLEPGDHGSTFGGTPLAATVAVAVLRTIEERGLLDNAERVGARLRDGLLGLRECGLPVETVRGRGLMLAAVLGDDIAPVVVDAGLEQGVVLNATGPRVIRLVPPLTLSADEADEGVRRLATAMELALQRRGDAA
ncbi:MAG: acetylornithine transaminase [Chloroflexi bacterium]|nr:MAG: acetylornithine transaminase [Chloroflexota bacterium]